MSRPDTARAWTDPEDAPDLSTPDWQAKIDAAPVSRPRGRRRSDVPKALTSLRLSADVLDGFKATGAGWQTRIDAALWDTIERLNAEGVGDAVEHRRGALDALIERRKGHAKGD